MGQGQGLLVKTVLHSGNGEPGKINAHILKQLHGGDAVFDGHASPPMENDGMSRCRQHHGCEGKNRCGPGATVVGHPEGNGQVRALAVKGWTMGSVVVQHARQLLGFRAADAMGNEKSPHLCGSGVTVEHQRQGLRGFLSGETAAGVFATANFAQ